MLGPFAIASRLTPIHQVSLAVLSRAACASMSTTTTTTTTRDRGDCYGPMEWAQYIAECSSWVLKSCQQVMARAHCQPLPGNAHWRHVSYWLQGDLMLSRLISRVWFLLLYCFDALYKLFHTVIHLFAVMSPSY